MDEHSIYTQLSEDQKERRTKYRNFAKGMMRERDAMEGEMNRKVIYGSDDFVKSLKEQFKVDAIIKRRGRPKRVI
ncbi:MAG: hypothetical protein SV062_07225 [Thermodesulfobacteriota bacterium]|nr:hypothetical protein [Thermodesulfobacteriota bacterium]